MTKLGKYLERQVAEMEYPRLLLNKDKYSTAYYLVQDEAALWRACLMILKVRVDSDYMQAPDDKPYDLQKVLPKEQVEALPEPYRSEELKKLKHNNRVTAEHQEEVEQWQQVQQALKDKDGKLAFMILKERNGHEYEGFEFEDLVVP